jgi:signal transduction histidine kinase
MALFFPQPRAPDHDDYRIIDAFCPVARIAIEHDRRAHALRLADERFLSLAANVPGVVYQRLVTPEGDIRYTYISEGARDLFGVSPREILANPQALFDCHGPEYRKSFRERLLAASRELSMWDVEAPIINRNGEHRWTHAIARPQRQPDGSVLWTGVILDNTRLKEASLELAAANRGKSEFLANVSHELRTPLNAIIGFSEMMLNETFGQLENDKYRDYLSDIRSSGTLSMHIINDILDLSKIESGNAEFAEEIIDPHEIIEKGIRLIAGKAAAQDISLSYDKTETSSKLRADRRKMKQVLINLLSNAVKFTPPGGKIHISAATADDGQLVISVSDTGIGIADEDLPKVLDPFVQVDSSLSRKYQGTGLGLSLTKAMIELHGGSLDLESRLGVGTIVTVRLPQERVIC